MQGDVIRIVDPFLTEVRDRFECLYFVNANLSFF